MLELSTVVVMCDPVPNGPGVEGHGEGVKYDNRNFYYRAGKCIPKDKVVHVTWEGNWAGRCNGDKEYLIIVWNGENFTVLEGGVYSGLKDKLKKYKGLSFEQAIDLRRQELAKEKAFLDFLPKCRGCGRLHLVLSKEDDPHFCGECRTI